MTEKILVIEDEVRIAQVLERGLIYEGYRVDVAYDGRTGLALARDNPPDLVILDWMLPGLTGREVCRQLRAKTNLAPLIFLTAKETLADTLADLREGANDYIKKPFHFEELLERIRVQLRPAGRPKEQFAVGSIVLDVATH